LAFRSLDANIAMSNRLLLILFTSVACSEIQAQAQFDCVAPAAPVLTAPTVLGNGNPGSVSTAQLQSALDGGGAIRLNVGASTISLSAELTITRETILDANGATLSGMGARRVLRVTNPSNLVYTFTLLNATIANGSTPIGSGAGLWKPTGGPWQAVTIRVFDTRFTNNIAIAIAQDDGGGAIYAVGARELTLVRTLADGNRGANGGAVYSLGSKTINLFDTTLSGNAATGTGGNPGNGGNAGAFGIDGADRHVNLCRTRLLGNTANAYGGGLFTTVYDQTSFTRIVDSTIHGNESTGTSNAHTGGAYIQGGPFLISGSTFRGNRAAGYGGLSLFNHGGTTTSGLIVNSTFVGNVARTGLGGAINMAATGGVTIQNVTIADNVAECAVCFAGGISNSAGAPLTLRNVLFRNNTGGNAWNPWNLLNAPVSGSHNVQWPQIRPVSNQAETAVTAGAMFANIALGAPTLQGGLTETMALPAASAANDAGTATSAPAVDQRGMPRFGAVDIGAYEAQPDLIFRNGFDLP